MNIKEKKTTADTQVVTPTAATEAAAEAVRGSVMGNAPKKGYKMSLTTKQAWTGFVFVIPWVIGFLLFFIQPLITSIQFAFETVNVKSLADSEFVGFDNFIYALRKDAQFPQLLYSNIQNLFINVPVILVFSFFVSLLLKEKFKGVNVVKGIFFLPIILASGLFVSLQSASSGDASALDSAMNAVENSSSSGVAMLSASNLENYLIQMGIQKDWIEILVTPINNLYSVLTTSGIQIFVFLAGLNSISPSLYEACYIEGASGWETFWKITFPMMVPMILVNTVYSIIDTFTSASNTLMTYVYNLTYRSLDFGHASAMNWLYFLILGVIMGIVAFLISRKTFYYT